MLDQKVALQAEPLELSVLCDGVPLDVPFCRLQGEVDPLAFASRQNQVALAALRVLHGLDIHDVAEGCPLIPIHLVVSLASKEGINLFREVLHLDCSDVRELIREETELEHLNIVQEGTFFLLL